MFMLSLPNFTFLQELSLHPEFVAFKKAILSNPYDHSNCIIVQELFLQKGRIWLPKGLQFIQVLLEEFHVTLTGGHMGIKMTLVRVGENFIWTGIKNDVQQFLGTCID